MSEIHPADTDFDAHKETYASEFDPTYGAPRFSPKRELIIVTCMDARIDSFAQLGLNLGDAHIIRNAGGLAQESIRSIVISQRLLQTREINLYHHTDCGMQTFTTSELRQQIKDAALGDISVAEAADKMDFLEFSDLAESVRSNVKFIQEHPLVLPGTIVTGSIYDVKSRRVKPVI